jgi:cholesterol transport system auxiliary component
MKGIAAFVLTIAAMVGCAPGPRPGANVSYYDLGSVAAAPNNRVIAALRGIDVFAPSWLDSSALQYRQLHVSSQRRQNYTESRWAAPPAELVALALRQRMLSGSLAGACKLRVDLDEFAHVFHAANSSHGLLEARVQLLAPGGAELLARRAFSVSRPATSVDAKGGASALSGAVEEFSGAVHEWLGGLDHELPSGSNMAARCRS